MESVNTLERSTYSGQPVQLYQFRRQSGSDVNYWLYNSSDRDLEYAGALYEAIAISDEGVRLTGEAASAEFKIHLPATAQFCNDFRAAGAPPSDSIYVFVYRAHAGTITGLDELVPVVQEALLSWTGTVDGLTQTN